MPGGEDGGDAPFLTPRSPRAGSRRPRPPGCRAGPRRRAPPELRHQRQVAGRQRARRRRHARRSRPPGAAASSGVSKRSPISTSKPRSANAEAITFWPRSWPSWPILATRIAGRRPVGLGEGSPPCVTRVGGGRVAGLPPIDARRLRCASWRPKTSSSAAQISPTVACARAALTASSSRLPSRPRPLAVRASSAAATRPRRASALSRFSFAIWPARTAVLSTCRTSRRLVVGAVAVHAHHGLPPPSMRAWVRAAASSMRSFGRPASMAARHAAQRLHLGDVAQRALGQVGGQALDVVAAAPGIDDPGLAALLLQEELRVAADPRREVGRQRQGLVQRVGVQALGCRPRGRHRLDAPCGRRC